MLDKSDKNIIDVGIIGCGPAGLSAAINIYARNKKSIIFGNKINSSALFKAEKINNHLGIQNLSGKQILEKFLAHAKEINIKIKTGRVTQIMPINNYFAINFENEIFQAKTIVLATGILKTKTNKIDGIDGEKKFLGQGVSYCATCDGRFYKNKSVVVIADGDHVEHDLNFLAELCQEIIFIPQYKSNLKNKSNMKIVSGTPKKILGDTRVKALILSDETDQTDKKILCDGIFIINEKIHVDKIISGLKFEKSAIKINNLCETNLNGVFAAGDCTGWPFQLSKAIGQGQIAGQNACRYIDKVLSQEINKKLS